MKVNHVLVLLVNLHPLQTTQHIYYWNHICFKANLNWAEIGVLSILGEYIGWEGTVLNTVKHNLYHIPYHFFNQSIFRIKLIYIFDDQNKNWYTITCIFKEALIIAVEVPFYKVHIYGIKKKYFRFSIRLPAI